LAIQSRLGVGTDIELWLPISAEEVEAAPNLEAAPSDALNRGTALLVDDDDLVRMSTADMLSDLGYAVFEANSAEEGLRVLQTEKHIDLVVTDHLMPGMPGTELARHIRSKWPRMPILLVSGYAELAGVDADLPRLTKPFRKDELADFILSIAAQQTSAI
jgi:CheY-like chemotaxis protein